MEFVNINSTLTHEEITGLAYTNLTFPVVNFSVS